MNDAEQAYCELQHKRDVAIRLARSASDETIKDRYWAKAEAYTEAIKVVSRSLPVSMGVVVKCLEEICDERDGTDRQGDSGCEGAAVSACTDDGQLQKEFRV